MHKFLSRMSAAALLLAVSGSALAVTNGRVPEPGILELVAVAAVVGFIARKRRK